MAGLNVGLGCGLGTETGVLPTGGCCFFLKESYRREDVYINKFETKLNKNSLKKKKWRK